MTRGGSAKVRDGHGERTLELVGGYAAVASAVVAVIYSVAFVILEARLLYSLALAAGGLLSAVALVAVYERLRATEPPLARLGLLLGFAGTMGAAIHGAFDLANVLHPPSGDAGGFPNQVDPRGFLTFGVSGLAVLVLSAVAWRGARFPPPLLYLGAALGVLLILTYLSRLIVLDPSSLLVLVPAGLTGLVASPLWYAWVGYLLITGREGA
jgi:hypothetical protein